MMRVYLMVGRKMMRAIHPETPVLLLLACPWRPERLQTPDLTTRYRRRTLGLMTWKLEQGFTTIALYLYPPELPLRV